jgi:hypothetical protein
MYACCVFAYCGGVALTRTSSDAAVTLRAYGARAPLASFACVVPLRLMRHAVCDVPDMGHGFLNTVLILGYQTTWTTGLDYGDLGLGLDYGPWATGACRPGLGLRIPEFQTWNLDPGPKLQTTKAAGWLPRLA